VLEEVTKESARFTTAAVRAELSRGATQYPDLQEVLGVPWLGTVGDNPETLTALANYTRRIGRAGRNLGEASVLAWCKIHRATAVLDDETGVKLAKREGITYLRSLGLIADAIRQGILSELGATTIVDLLADSEAYFPCTGSEFIVWCHENDIALG
jgi:hypothetical protein